MPGWPASTRWVPCVVVMSTQALPLTTTDKPMSVVPNASTEGPDSASSAATISVASSDSSTPAIWSVNWRPSPPIAAACSSRSSITSTN